MRLLLPLAAVMALGFSSAVAVRAQDQAQPRYLPTRDVTVTYQVSSSQKTIPNTVVAHITPTGDVRIDTPDRGSVIYDVGRARAAWILPKGQIYFEIPVRGSLAGALIPQKDARFTRLGTAIVDGIACTNWRVVAQQGNGTGCVTDDGVILRAEGNDAKGETGSVLATNVAFGPSSPEMFQPPPGAHRLDIPGKLSGLMRMPQ